MISSKCFSVATKLNAKSVAANSRRVHIGATRKSPAVATADEAVKAIKSNDRIFVHGIGATPNILLDAMVKRAPELRNVELIHLHTEGPAKYTLPEFQESFYCNNLFCGSNVRKAVNEGRAGYIPVFLSEVPLLFTRGILPIDVALLHVSPPDRHGFCSLGVSVDVAITAASCAKYVIAQVNPQMPRTHGDGIVHISAFDSIVPVDAPIHELVAETPDAVQNAIGKHVANLVEDGATLQMGIGAIPNAVLAELRNHKELGIHTEMFSDGVIDLVERGVVTNEHKVIHRHQIVSGFCNGTKKVYNFINDNPLIKFLRIEEVNDPNVIKQNPRVTAINSCIEVDLTGQICSDSIGGNIFSGVGGQMDFMRGAALSEGGKPIIALPSTTSKGASRIVPFLKRGAGVVTTRAHAHYVVTEYGVAYLFGKNINQRAEALIKIAHPKHRATLEQALSEKYWQTPEKEWKLD